MNLIRMYQNRKKVLGQNERNLKYIRAYNKKRAKEIADNKILTKKVLQAENIPTPQLLGVIADLKELREFDWESLPNSFVLKPVHGLEGAGIEIFYNKDKEGNWIKSDGTKVNINQLRGMVIDILDGKFSLHNQKDSAFFEERVKPHKSFKYYAFKGTPDVRVIVFNNIPVMSYVRLPTKESKGKANLALGAVGAAIDMVTGTTTTAIIGKGTEIETIPGTKLSVSGLKIPKWDELLATAIKVQRATNLGLAAIDFLIDREKGPVVIELNARPGLSIQLANRDGLRWRLKKAAGLKVTTISKGIRIAKDLFGGQTEEELERVSGKQLVSHIEPVEIITENNNKISTLALIDTSRRTTTIEAKLARKAGIIDEETQIEETTISDITFTLAGETIDTDCRIVPSKIRGYQLLVGRKDLGNFLIDIRRVARGAEGEQRKEMMLAKPFTSPEKIDEVIQRLIHGIKLIPYIRPLNLKDEVKKFERSHDYNPQFDYKPVDFDTDKYIEELNRLNPDPSNILGKLFIEKIDELKKQIYLMEAIADDEKFAQRSAALYNTPDENLFNEAMNIINTVPSPSPIKPGEKPNYLSSKEVEKILKSALKEIGVAVPQVNFVNGPGAPNKASFNKRTFAVLINQKYKFTEEKLKGTIAHEIEVHARRKVSAKKFPYKIFTYGTAGYLETEEGLAVWNKKEKLQSMQPVRNAALMYISGFLNYSSSFTQTYQFLIEHGVSHHNALRYTLRTKRGMSDTSKPGAFLKDNLYLSGYLKVEKMTQEEREKLLENGKTKEIIAL